MKIASSILVNLALMLLMTNVSYSMNDFINGLAQIWCKKYEKMPDISSHSTSKNHPKPFLLNQKDRPEEY
ncbi:MAG: hypothetical protein Q8S21_06350 [Candidatus Paracaedibacteraceae bacterium]|nr:hypothetical protein [Candidatus Paracaedibacteraceae bacterium]